MAVCCCCVKRWEVVTSSSPSSHCPCSLLFSRKALRICLLLLVLICMSLILNRILGGNFINNLIMATICGAATASGREQSPGQGSCSNTSSTDSPTPTPTPYSVAYVTISNEDAAQKLAQGLVEKRLAACVNIIPKVISVYEWKGKVEKDSEALMMIKTRTSRVEELTDFVRKNHPYEVCEVISVAIQAGNPPYLNWLGDCVPP